MLRHLFAAASVVPAALALYAQTDVVMNRYDQAATSANTRERILNSSNVTETTFGKLYSYYVDGAVYAQPLYVASVEIPGRGTHNVLYVATMNDKVYAFDAGKPGPPLWMRTGTDEMAGITPVPITDITNNNGLNLVGNVGIEGTPVIDSAAHAIFFVARTRENGNYVERLHKLDLRDGSDLAPAAAIEAAAPGTAQDAVNGVVRFDPKAGHQRPALALVNGVIVIAWASHEDIRPYHGWVMAYDAKTLRQIAAWCVTPDGAEGGIWQSGRGPAIDGAGNIFYETGNGTWDGDRNFGTSVVKLAVGAGRVTVEDYFTPHDWEALNQRDVDLGSTGPLLIPGTDLILCGNKKGILYLLDGRHLGKLTAEDKGLLQAVEVNGGRDLAGPAYWDGPSGPTIYLWTEADFLKGFRFDGHLLTPVPFAKGSAASHGSPGGSLTVSSDGKKPGTGIVWGTATTAKSADHGNAAGTLYAFDAETLKLLWSSETKARRDRLGTLVKFVPPTVVNGRVYVPNYDDAVIVYGILDNSGS
jgi:outer membrane protein assembly factor BamB